MTVVRRLADFRTEWCHQCECGGQQFLLVAAEHDAIVGTTGCLRCGKTQPADWVYDVAKDVLRDAVRDARRFDEHLTAWRDNNAWHAAEIDRLSSEVGILKKRIRLVADDIAFFGFDSALVLNCGDTFAYACADAEDVPDDQIDLVRRMHDKFGYTGLVAWIASRRKCEPLIQRQTAAYREARAFLDSTTVPTTAEGTEK